MSRIWVDVVSDTSARMSSDPIRNLKHVEVNWMLFNHYHLTSVTKADVLFRGYAFEDSHPYPHIKWNAINQVERLPLLIGPKLLSEIVVKSIVGTYKIAEARILRFKEVLEERKERKR